MADFYTQAGLEEIGKLIEQAQKQKKMTRNEFARLTGVAPNTLKALERGTLEEPKPTTLLRLAPLIEDPYTGCPFDPEDFLNIARGRRELPLPDDDFEVMPTNVGLLIQHYLQAHGISRPAFARAAGMLKTRIDQIADTNAVPTVEELDKIAKAFNKHSNFQWTGELLQRLQRTPKKRLKKQQGSQQHNGARR